MEIYYSNTIEDNKILLNEEESRHCIKVMRYKVDDEIFVTDGQGMLFKTKIQIADAKECVLDIGNITCEDQAPPILHIAIAPTKNIDRFEWFLEKATEIGVSEITPIICSRSERNKFKPERCEKIILSAAKQSLRLWLPKLNSITKLNEIFNWQSAISNQKFICHCQAQNLPSLKSLYQRNENVLILIGPEGDFTLEEINLAEQHGFKAASLSSARLRTETAGMVAAMTVVNDQ